MGLMRKQDIFMVLKYYCKDCLLVAKGNYTIKKSGNTFDQVINISITNEGLVDIMHIQMSCPKEGTTSFL